MKTILFSSLCAIVTFGLGPAAPAGAGATLGLDLETLNELLPALSAGEIAVPLGGGRPVGVLLENLRVTGLDPATDSGPGHILTSMRVRIPQLGLDLPVEPRLSLRVVQQEAVSVLELRFEKVEVNVALVGTLDIAAFLPPLRFPAESLFHIDGAAGAVRVRSRLTGVEMGRNVVRLGFDLDATEAP